MSWRRIALILLIACAAVAMVDAVVLIPAIIWFPWFLPWGGAGFLVLMFCCGWLDNERKGGVPVSYLR